MSKPIFSITYSALHQRRFEESLKDGQLETALQILERFPNATLPKEKIERLIVMVEGYKAVAQSKSGLENGELKSYRNLGSLAEIEKQLEQLREIENAVNFV